MLTVRTSMFCHSLWFYHKYKQSIPLRFIDEQLPVWCWRHTWRHKYQSTETRTGFRTEAENHSFRLKELKSENVLWTREHQNRVPTRSSLITEQCRFTRRANSVLTAELMQRAVTFSKQTVSVVLRSGCHGTEQPRQAGTPWTRRWIRVQI